MLKEFKEFAMKGNVVDLAIAVVLGTAFGLIIKAFVANIITPLVGMLLGGVDLTALHFSVGEAVFTYGIFIQAVIDFVLIALVLFFVIKGINASKKKEEATPAAPPAPSKEEVLLSEIRDLLKK